MCLCDGSRSLAQPLPQEWHIAGAQSMPCSVASVTTELCSTQPGLARYSTTFLILKMHFISCININTEMCQPPTNKLLSNFSIPFEFYPPVPVVCIIVIPTKHSFEICGVFDSAVKHGISQHKKKCSNMVESYN